jgi:hypothetical protein
LLRTKVQNEEKIREREKKSAKTRPIRVIRVPLSHEALEIQ